MKTTLLMIVISAAPLLQAVQAPPDPQEARNWQATQVAQGISHPWGMTWLPDGRMLVTSRDGALYTLNGNRFDPVPMDPLPNLLVSGEGGLLDVAAHPADRGESVRLYFTLAVGTEERNQTALARGVYRDGRVDNIEILFRAQPLKSGGSHFGSRLFWLPDGTLLMSVGDGGNPPLRIGDRLARRQAQNPVSHLGKILRLTENGDPVPDNPFIGDERVKPEIYTFGNRNVQGFAMDPAGRLWATEHGPRGGDELNRIKAGKNYGWPRQSYGTDYRTGEPVGQPVVPGTKQPRTWWTPAIAPSGMAAYTGNDFPRWQGSLFIAGLVSQDIRLVVLDENGRIRFHRRLPIGARVRHIQQGPDGKLYVLIDETEGRLLRIDPA